ncbi:MAG: TetR/AcrR family transcriptional regulator [Anaerolineaceae bacterium]|nr:TetR/AcrR family transcriptional regulator [Anaerolineaceae bacterium]
MAGSNRREDILRATAHLLEIQGYAATGLNEIIEHSGAPKGSLYYYFPEGKEQIVIEALCWAGGMVLEFIQETLGEHEMLEDAFSALTERISKQMGNSGYQLGATISIVALEMSARSETIRECCAQIYADWEQTIIERMLKEEIRLVDAAETAGQMMMLIEGGVLLSRTRQTLEPMSGVDRAIRTLLRSLKSS